MCLVSAKVSQEGFKVHKLSHLVVKVQANMYPQATVSVDYIGPVTPHHHSYIHVAI